MTNPDMSGPLTLNQVRAALAALGACDASRRWLDAFQGTPTEAWGACDQPDWMLWIAGRAGVDPRLAVLAACDCVEPTLAYVPDHEPRPRIAIDAVRGWCEGVISTAKVQDARIGAARAAGLYAEVVDIEYRDARAAAQDRAVESVADAACLVASAVAALDVELTHAAFVRASDAAITSVGAARAFAEATVGPAAGEAAAAEALRAACDAIRARIPADMILAALAACGRAA